MKTGHFFTEGTNYSTLETYFIQEELGAPSNYPDAANEEVTNYRVL
jgi:hypothetical protein